MFKNVLFEGGRNNMYHTHRFERGFDNGEIISESIRLTSCCPCKWACKFTPFERADHWEISNRLNVLFTPAGYVFSIWGGIYILLGTWVIRQFPRSRRDLPVYQTTSLLFFINCLLNSFWIFMWHYEGMVKIKYKFLISFVFH